MDILKRCSKCDNEMVECSFDSYPVIVKSQNQKLYECKSSKVIPYVCVNCGHIEFYANSPQNLVNK